MTDKKDSHDANHGTKAVTRKPAPVLNLEYKDSVFRFLIGSDKQHALSLVNAITGRNYPPETEVEYNTIGSMIYMGIRNDVSFVIHDFMYLFEHQSSLNPNMSLREFLYFARKINAIDECIEKGILVKFLQEHRLEVRDMSLEEFNVEEYTELIKEDSYNQGKADGKAEGKAEGKVEGLKTVAKHMHSRGDDISYIADTLNVSIEQVKEWVGSTPT